jgi:hypothetical protein
VHVAQLDALRDDFLSSDERFTVGLANDCLLAVGDESEAENYYVCHDGLMLKNIDTLIEFAADIRLSPEARHLHSIGKTMICRRNSARRDEDLEGFLLSRRDRLKHGLLLFADAIAEPLKWFKTETCFPA